MGQIVTAVCKCKDYSEDNLVNAEGKNYFTSMTPGWMMIHIIMVFFTFSFWIGWMGFSWLLKGTVYVCTECGNEVDKTYLRIGKTKNVVVQTSEVKEITVSSNKKSEEVSVSIEKRLEDLSDLKEKGLINDDEYENKRKEILKDL